MIEQANYTCWWATPTIWVEENAKLIQTSRQCQPYSFSFSFFLIKKGRRKLNRGISVNSNTTSSKHGQMSFRDNFPQFLLFLDFQSTKLLVSDQFVHDSDLSQLYSCCFYQLYNLIRWEKKKQKHLQDQDVSNWRILLPHPQRSMAYSTQHNMWDCWENRQLFGHRPEPPEVQCDHIPRQERRAHPRGM